MPTNSGRYDYSKLADYNLSTDTDFKRTEYSYKQFLIKLQT